MIGMNNYSDMSWKCRVFTSLLTYGCLHDIISENHLVGFILIISVWVVVVNWNALDGHLFCMNFNSQECNGGHTFNWMFFIVFGFLHVI